MYVKQFSNIPGLLKRKIGTEMEICLVVQTLQVQKMSLKNYKQLVLYFIFCKYCIPYYVYIVHTWEVHYSFVMKVCILTCPNGRCFVYIQRRNFTCVLRHMEDQFICTRYRESFLKKQLSISRWRSKCEQFTNALLKFKSVAQSL